MEALALEASSDAVQKGINFLKDPLLIVDIEGKIFYSNPAASILIKSSKLSIHRLIREGLKEQKEKSFELKLRTQSSTQTYWAQRSIIRSDDGVFEGLVFCFQDNARFQKAGADHEATELFDNIDLLAVGLNSEGRITFVNKYFSERTGWKPEDIIGADWMTRFVPADEREKMTECLSRLSSGSIPYLEDHSELATKTGDFRSISWHWTHFKDSRGQIVGMAAIGEDLTEKKIQDKNLREMQKQIEQNREEVMAFISHEVRSPLMGISIALEKIEERSPESSHDVQAIRDQVDRIEKVSRDLIDSFIYRSGELRFAFKRVSLRTLMTRLTARFRALYRHHENFSLDLILPNDDALVSADENRLDQALSNLISNAIKYSKPEYVRVRLSLSKNDSESVYRIDIQDEGVGIPSENYSQLFQLFCRGSNVKRSPRQGLGIGLKMAKDIIRRHNGDITFVSELDIGTTFSVNLPL